MPELDPHLLTVAIRWLHVVAMAVALGGAVLLLVLSLGPASVALEGALMRAADGYEHAFWGAIGILVMTGIGNLAAFGAQLPSPDSRWGTTMLVKLGGVLVLALLSLPRTVAVARMASLEIVPDGAAPAGVGPGGRASSARRIRDLYGATTALLLAILGLAVWLSHA